MTTAINYLHGDIDPDREEEAFIKLANYLVLKGQYKDEAAARKDAEQRVDFLEKADIYADDPKMDNASWELKAIHALIAAHTLNDVLQANDGQLPDPDQPKPAPPPEAEAPPGKRSITNVFGSIELDLRTGLSRQQIITKLEDDGLSTENAEEAYDFVRRQHARKRTSRLAAAAAIVVLSVAMFYLSDLFL